MSHTILLKIFEDPFTGKLSENSNTLGCHSAGIQVVPHKAANKTSVASEDETESVKDMTNIFLVLVCFFLFSLSKQRKRIGLALLGSIWHG